MTVNDNRLFLSCFCIKKVEGSLISALSGNKFTSRDPNFGGQRWYELTTDGCANLLLFGYNLSHPVRCFCQVMYIVSILQFLGQFFVVDSITHFLGIFLIVYAFFLTNCVQILFSSNPYLEGSWIGHGSITSAFSYYINTVN